MKRTTRRTFLKHAAAGAALPLVLPPLVRAESPNNKINLGAVGVAGKGESDIHNTSQGQNVIALCDVDAGNLARAAEKYEGAKAYADWRRMIEEQGERLDGITVSTPDHMHAAVALAAFDRGIATYVQKPLTRTVHEARELTRGAERAGVVTQMGNQGHNGIAYRMTVKLIQSGAIGKIKEAHAWSNRPFWPQGVERPAGSDAVPDSLDWDLWLGVAPERPYKKDAYHPFNWRGWYDFGTGSLGDMGCHILDPVYWALGLTAPKTVAYDGPEPMEESFPIEETISYVFAGTRYTTGDEITVRWYDGGRKPSEELIPEADRRDLPDNGMIFVGEEGVILTPHGGGPQILPRERFADYERPRLEPRDHYMQWTNAVRGEDEVTNPFSYAGRLTETVLLGVIASRVGGDQPLAWDDENLRFTNSDRANRYIEGQDRDGWRI